MDASALVVKPTALRVVVPCAPAGVVVQRTRVLPSSHWCASWLLPLSPSSAATALRSGVARLAEIDVIARMRARLAATRLGLAPAVTPHFFAAAAAPCAPALDDATP